MMHFFFILFYLAMIVFVIGAIHPQLFGFSSRKKLLKISGAILFLSITAIGFTSQQTLPTATTTNASLSLIVEPEAGITPLLSLINHATSSVDLVMYELSDVSVETALATAKNHGVNVRVLLNHGYYGDGKTTNTSAYTFLQSHGVSVHWTPAYFALTHQKTLIIDNTTALIMTGNLTPKYYASDRDFWIVDTDSLDITAIENAFASDWNGANTVASNGTDLIWSPNSEQTMLSLITNATSSLFIYNEEMADQKITDALAQKAKNGLRVEIVMSDQSSWHTAFDELVKAGAHVSTYTVSAPLYIHAKMILADTRIAFVGSENFSTNSLQKNRELGIETTNPAVLEQLISIFKQDQQKATPFSY